MGKTTEELPGIVLETLNEKNCTAWAKCMQNYLIGKGLWEIVDGSQPEPKPTESALKSMIWRKKNEKALYAIRASCDSRMVSRIREESSAKAAWDLLVSVITVETVQFTGTADRIGTSSAGSGSDNNIKDIVSLYKAVTAGDWEKTKTILKSPEAASIEISSDGATALHVAVLHDKEDLVEKLAEFMLEKDLERTCRDGETALHLAATGRNLKMAKAMIKKNRKILCLRNADGNVPICVAALYGDKKMSDYLYSMTPDDELDPDKAGNSGSILLGIAVNAENYDLALRLFEKFPLFATKEDNLRICLSALAQKVTSFPSESQRSTWQRYISKYTDCKIQEKGPSEERIDIEDPIEECCRKKNPSQITKRDQAMDILKLICEQLAKLNSTNELESLVMPAMLQATEAGNVGFIHRMIKSEYLALEESGTLLGRILCRAVKQRQESMWKLGQDLIPEKLKHHVASVEDERGNNILHMAAMYAPEFQHNRIAVPAMQMQRELRFFKEVKDFVPRTLQEKENRDGKTPQTLFDEQHDPLATEAREWMKTTATSCMVVATLIAAVMFEGANDTQTWDSKLISYWYTFHTYMVADALSLLFSTMSALTFLSIFTSARSSQEDLLDHLPCRFIIGMLTLFLSIGTMMLAFGILFYVNLSQSQYWSALGFSFLALLPVFLFGALHFRLLVEMITHSTKFLKR